MFKKILIADRSENALNIIRCCREMGIQTVALFSDIDFNALHIVLADYCFHLHGTTFDETYGNADAIIDAAKTQECDAIYPGLNFFNLNTQFAEKVKTSGLTMIGPSVTEIDRVNDYFNLTQDVDKLGVKSIECKKVFFNNPTDIYRDLNSIGYPALIRYGSHYRDISMVKQQEDVDILLNQLSKSDCVPEYVVIQKYIYHAKLIGIRLLADKMGTCISLHDFNASVQINAKPQIIQCPCVELSDDLRNQMYQKAREIALELKLTGVITIEFVIEQNEIFFWDIELSLTDSSTLTELITDINLYEYQIKLSAGDPLKLEQSDVSIEHYAILAYIKAEDPLVGFQPSIKKINRYLPASGYGLCLESAAYEGYNLPNKFGTSIGRLFSWGKNREMAISRLKRGLKEFIITGPRTNIPFFLYLLDHPKFLANQLHTNFVEEEFSRMKLRQFYDTDARSIELERAAITSALSYYLKSEETNFKTSDSTNIGNWNKYHRFWETAYKD